MSSVVGLVLVAALGLPAPQGTAPDQGNVPQWARELGDPRAQVHEAARQHLIKAGHPAIPALLRVAAGENLEAALRAVAVLKQLALKAETDAAGDVVAVALLQVVASAPKVSHHATQVLFELEDRAKHRVEKLGGHVQTNGARVVSVYLDDVKALDQALPLLRRFRALDNVSISNPLMTDALMVELHDLPNLKSLNLFESNIGDDGLKHLKNLPKLLRVPMGRTKVTDAGLIHLKDLKQLEYVGVRGNNVTDVGLAQLRGLTNLTGLNLNETKVTDAGLVNLRGLTKLNYLPLSHTKVTDAGLEHLKALSNLEDLHLGQTQVTPQGVANLQKAIPKTRISLED